MSPDLINSVFVAHDAREALHDEARVSELTRIFQANGPAVRRTLLDSPEEIAKLGRHAVLNHEFEAVIVASVL
jgi:hypothetical protein